MIILINIKIIEGKGLEIDDNKPKHSVNEYLFQ